MIYSCIKLSYQLLAEYGNATSFLLSNPYIYRGSGDLINFDVQMFLIYEAVICDPAGGN
jgi:hypothetical protein